MDIQGILSALGSIASIAAIPLSIYLYLRAQEEKLATSRRDILRTLSYQLGEGRPVTLFEIEAVRESVLRMRRLKRTSISPAEVVNDLVTETISNPMISVGRKESILLELERALLIPSVRDVIGRHRLTASRLLSMVGEPVPEAMVAAELKSVVVAVEREVTNRTALTSTAFGLLAAVTSIVAVLSGLTDMSPRLREILGEVPAPEFLLGLLASLFAAAMTIVVEKLFLVRGHSERAQAREADKAGRRSSKLLQPTAPDEEERRRD